MIALRIRKMMSLVSRRSFGGRLDCSRDDVAAAGKCYNTQEEERGYMYTNASENKQWAEEEEILKDYERIYPPQPLNKRPLRIPPYKAMEEHAFQENAKQVERLTVPLHQSRAGGDQADQNDGDTSPCSCRSHDSSQLTERLLPQSPPGMLCSPVSVSSSSSPSPSPPPPPPPPSTPLPSSRTKAALFLLTL